MVLRKNFVSLGVKMHTVNTLGCAASWRQFPGELPMKRLVMILVKERLPFGL